MSVTQKLYTIKTFLKTYNKKEYNSNRLKINTLFVLEYNS